MPVTKPLLPFTLPGVSLLQGLTCHVILPVLVDGTIMVRGPAARRKAFEAETESLCFESEFSSLESNERNLFQVTGTSRQVAGNPAAMSTAPDTRVRPFLFRVNRETWPIETFAQSLETLSRTFESFTQRFESNERNLFRVGGNLHQLVSPWSKVWQT